MKLRLMLEGSRESRTIDRGTLSIGRAPGNDWVLADPNRYLSKTHCSVAWAGGHYILTDLSTNGVYLNGSRERARRDADIVLNDGDQFRIGDHVISVAEILPPEPRAGARRHDPLGEASFGDGGFGGRLAAQPDPLGGDPLNDPFGAGPASGFAHSFDAAPPMLRQQDPFDRADELTPQRAPHLDTDLGRDFDSDLFRGGTPTDPWRGPAQPDNVDAPNQAFAVPKPLAPVSLDDIDALLGDDPPGMLPVANGVRPATPAASTVADSAPPGTAAAPATREAAQLLAAFLEGAGVANGDFGRDPEQAMREAGALFRTMVEGLRQVLISRASIKKEFRVDYTMVRARDNNPIKLSVTDQDAVAALLQPARPGYQAPLDSTREAFDDIRSHELALMVGVQTALMALLRRFDPAALEKRLAAGMLDSVLPAARKARNWEVFCSAYQDIAREAEDDFQSAFGREFARAYDAQIKKH